MSDTSTKTTAESTVVTPDEIRRYVGRLGSEDVVERQQTRQSLAQIGAGAVPHVLPLLKSSDSRERWEAAKTLVPIRDPAAVEALIDTFESDDENLRWVAGQALIAIGQPAVDACLTSIINRISTGFMRQGMHHVMHEFAGKTWGQFLYPVWEALDSAAWSMAGPLAAERALCEWRDQNAGS